MSASLPLEMISAIIDHLHDDKQSLNACSLVCKAWTHQARVHLFSRLVLDLEWSLQWQLAVFPYVRHLELLHYQLYDAASTWDGVTPLLVGFHRIVSLELYLGWHSLDAINPQWWSTLGKSFSVVVSLTLTSFSFTNPSSVAQVFCAFHCLRELSIRKADCTQSTSTGLVSATAFRLPPNLHTFELDNLDINILEWFPSLPICPAFRTVRLYDIRPGDLAMFHRFIGALGDGLESLSLSTDIWTDILMDIAPLTRLRSIEFIAYVGDDQNQWVTQTLSHISSACLEDVTFKLDVSESNDMANALEWSNVDAVLQHSTFSRLRNVYFQRSPYYTPRSTIMQYLPQCTARGILRVDQQDA